MRPKPRLSRHSRGAGEPSARALTASQVDRAGARRRSLWTAARTRERHLPTRQKNIATTRRTRHYSSSVPLPSTVGVRAPEEWRPVDGVDDLTSTLRGLPRPQRRPPRLRPGPPSRPRPVRGTSLQRAAAKSLATPDYVSGRVTDDGIQAHGPPDGTSGVNRVSQATCWQTLMSAPAANLIASADRHM